MKRDLTKWKKNGLGEGGLLSLRSQSTERERERGLILTLREPEIKFKDNFNIKKFKNKKLF